MMEFKLTMVAVNLDKAPDEMYLAAQVIDCNLMGTQVISKSWNPKCQTPDLSEFSEKLGNMLVSRFVAEDSGIKSIKEKHAT